MTASACTTSPLNALKTGKRCRIVALRGCREFQHRAQSIGLEIGSEVEVLQASEGGNHHGPMAIRVGDTRLMLGHGMTSKIIVRATPAEEDNFTT